MGLIKDVSVLTHLSNRFVDTIQKVLSLTEILNENEKNN